MDYLNDMALFVEVVKTRSFRRAADALGMPNSTLSRRISLLEQGIGLRLMNRTTRKIELTEAGQLYYERCSRIVEEARIAYEELGDMVAQPSGILRVSLPVDFATTYIAPLLPEFSVRYPGISFDFDLTPRNVDLVSEPFDLAIRMGMPEGSTLISRVIARISAQFYASPAYLEANGTPSHPLDLGKHQCLTMPTMPTWTSYAGNETQEVKIGSRFRMNSVSMIRQLAGLGMGIAFLPERIVADDLKAGKLKSILPIWQGAPISVHVVTETRLLPAKTQRFIEFVGEKLRNV
ncbi:LysR family transcriptional regulator [Ensifer sp. NM-2]|uniref:LysR family transcriptional regulator n=1 Tax=Ensifer TaxID=106591 RepID=UPI00070F9CF7|nr:MULTISPECIES: LysR family transcriptional regulator [Ensifer]KQU80241.1 LysR family transcriptional regulator [Ensifer sp. Root31]NOV21769.1 LysR family transcriptional regulator [Ensifer canadensis]PSS59573.1 LysR family transcriptional regulator [Ensifer sp. NM-2]